MKNRKKAYLVLADGTEIPLTVDSTTSASPDFGLRYTGTYAPSKNFEITEFKAQKLASIGSRKIVKNVEYNENNEPIFKNIENSPYEWLYYDKFSTDSNLEREFLDFIEANKERIDRHE